jgi:hypothetical protein
MRVLFHLTPDIKCYAPFCSMLGEQRWINNTCYPQEAFWWLTGGRDNQEGNTFPQGGCQSFVRANYAAWKVKCLRSREIMNLRFWSRLAHPESVIAVRNLFQIHNVLLLWYVSWGQRERERDPEHRLFSLRCAKGKSTFDKLKWFYLKHFWAILSWIFYKTFCVGEMKTVHLRGFLFLSWIEHD